MNQTYCGYIAIIGRPNVGKSTLLNDILGQKISITSQKPQTTRHQILGIKTDESYQMIFIDTPGLHLGGKRAINRYMNRAASAVIHDVDVIIFMIEAGTWNKEDEWALQKIKKVECPVICVINKIDQLSDRALLLPEIKTLNEKYAFTESIPISALDKINVENLEKTIQRHLPAQEFIFPADQITDKNERFIAAEIIREKIMRNLEQELPYATTVEIEQFEETEQLLRIAAVIWVEREGQKAIVIGAQGAQLKKLGTRARLELEKWFAKKVFLQLWVKVKENWSDNDRLLKGLGYQ